MTPDLTRAAPLIAKGYGDRRLHKALGITRHRARVLIAEAQRGTAGALIKIEPRTASEYAERIASCWRKSVEAIFEVGRLLIRAKEQLVHGEFEAMVESHLPFKPTTARRLMIIAHDERLSKRAHVHVLPPSWGTLYEITKLDDNAFEARIADGTIRPDMERRDIAAAVKGECRGQREAELGSKILALPDKRYGIILADPAWRFAPRSRETGMDRAADNHYPTTPTEQIMALDVPSIAAPNSLLELWATAPMLLDALEVMKAWGFEYKTHAIWHKLRPGEARGPGYWFTGEHELLLIGTRGHVPCPAPGDQWRSVIPADVRAHSVKPDWAYEWAEYFFPNLPKIELNARRARAGWDCWGAEAPPHDPITGEIPEPTQ